MWGAQTVIAHTINEERGVPFTPLSRRWRSPHAPARETGPGPAPPPPTRVDAERGGISRSSPRPPRVLCSKQQIVHRPERSCWPRPTAISPRVFRMRVRLASGSCGTNRRSFPMLRCAVFSMGSDRMRALVVAVSTSVTGANGGALGVVARLTGGVEPSAPSVFERRREIPSPGIP